MSRRASDAERPARIGLLAAYDFTILVTSLQRAFPVDGDHDFTAILREIDAAEEASNERPK